MTPLNPSSIAAPFGRYSHGVEVPANKRLVRTSGQLSLCADGRIPESPREQAKIIFDNIDAILAEAKMSKHDIFHIGAYVTDRTYMKEYMAARDEYLEGVEKLPASTLLIVSGFTKEEFKVEIEISAIAD